MTRKAVFHSPAHRNTIARTARAASAQPAMSRNSVTAAAPAQTSHARRNGAMPMKGRTIIDFTFRQNVGILCDTGVLHFHIWIKSPIQFFIIL